MARSLHVRMRVLSERKVYTTRLSGLEFQRHSLITMDPANEFSPGIITHHQ